MFHVCKERVNFYLFPALSMYNMVLLQATGESSILLVNGHLLEELGIICFQKGICININYISEVNNTGPVNNLSSPGLKCFFIWQFNTLI